MLDAAGSKKILASIFFGPLCRSNFQRWLIPLDTLIDLVLCHFLFGQTWLVEQLIDLLDQRLSAKRFGEEADTIKVQDTRILKVVMRVARHQEYGQVTPLSLHLLEQLYPRASSLQDDICDHEHEELIGEEDL